MSKIAKALRVTRSRRKKFADGGAAGDDYNTTLSPDQEKAFQVWKQQNMSGDSGADYDQRGAYLAGLQKQSNGHWEDQFKKPNHPTFSDQSQYAPLAAHGTWAGDTFVPPSPMADGGDTLPDIGEPLIGDGGQFSEGTRDRAKELVGKAGGGGVGGNFNPERGSAFGLAKEGLIKSSVPGRTDKLNLNVPTGSYIIPADIPSALGQGNTDAGSSILNKMFSKGPYGMNLGKSKGPRIGTRHSSLHPMHFAKGGAVNPTTPIVAAGGEYNVHPDTVRDLGNGDINLGHQILDAFVKHVRAKHIKTLRKLPGPKGSK